MKMTPITARPSAHVAAWAPVSTAPYSFPATTVFRLCADQPAAVSPVTVDAPQVHQVQAQAELALITVRTRGDHGTNGSTVKGMPAGVAKRLTAAARGVPPRGRPV